MRMDFNYENTNGLANALGGRIDLLEKMLGLKVREGLKYADIQKIVKSGFANEFFDLGDEIMTKYTATNGTVYDFPWIVVDFRDVIWEDGTIHPGMVLQSKQATIESVQYDASEGVLVGNDETVAEEGCYYFGTNGNVSAANLIELNPGDELPKTEYSNIYKNSEKTKAFLSNGNPRYSFSATRKWLNSSEVAGEWWTEAHVGDNPPSEANQINGFMHALPEDFLSAINPTAIHSDYYVEREDQENSYRLADEVTYDKFFLPNNVEVGATKALRSYNKYFTYWKKLMKEAGVEFPTVEAFNPRGVNPSSFLRRNGALNSVSGLEYINIPGLVFMVDRTTYSLPSSVCCVIS